MYSYPTGESLDGLITHSMSHINLSETNGRHARSTVVNLDSNR